VWVAFRVFKETGLPPVNPVTAGASNPPVKRAASIDTPLVSEGASRNRNRGKGSIVESCQASDLFNDRANHFIGEQIGERRHCTCGESVLHNAPQVIVGWRPETRR